eukprot:CAMPEP_0115360814 /NCGR_PEP_ID=MMETSP0270-20121206/101885_1 /TAXON_ID=71861 /ORGANISM="Scrippsiella trochoidea, Strain CCMP3099" /LENGTH=93 /DNA_ID=CAMNT_0002783369 /DNA_START=165 /DNA_END=443 /DNA_ORIENTATION=-
MWVSHQVVVVDVEKPAIVLFLGQGLAHVIRQQSDDTLALRAYVARCRTSEVRAGDDPSLPPRQAAPCKEAAQERDACGPASRACEPCGRSGAA